MSLPQTQSCDGYTSTSLMGNWYEDRNAVQQPQNQNRDYRKVLSLSRPAT